MATDLTDLSQYFTVSEDVQSKPLSDHLTCTDVFNIVWMSELGQLVWHLMSSSKRVLRTFRYVTKVKPTKWVLQDDNSDPSCTMTLILEKGVVYVHYVEQTGHKSFRVEYFHICPSRHFERGLFQRPDYVNLNHTPFPLCETDGVSHQTTTSALVPVAPPQESSTTEDLIVKLNTPVGTHCVTINITDAIVTQHQLSMAITMWLLMYIYDSKINSKYLINLTGEVRGRQVWNYDDTNDGNMLVQVTDHTIGVWSHGEFITFHIRAEGDTMIVETLPSEYDDLTIRAVFQNGVLVSRSDHPAVLFDGETQAMTN